MLHIDRRSMVGLIGAATLGLAACQPANPMPAKPQMQEITIKGTEYSFEIPASIQAGMITVNWENVGKEPHHAQFARLNDGVTMKQIEEALQKSADAALPLVTLEGGPAVIPPGKRAQVTLDLPAGQYLVLCLVPSHDGMPHVAKGMIKPLQVVAASNPAKMDEPKADVTITLKDFQFEISGQLKAGKQVVKVTNAGPQPHEIALIKLATGKTLDDVAAFMAKPEGQPPYEDAGGMQGLSIGRSAWVTLDLEAGNYVALCHIPDPTSGKDHTDLGMVMPFTVQ
ncbi:MAG: hypothetical protein M1546_14215 [Chloroflexi bacterium]|nr:hypothetical protein [Chloroflexota bacterium]